MIGNTKAISKRYMDSLFLYPEIPAKSIILFSLRRLLSVKCPVVPRYYRSGAGPVFHKVFIVLRLHM